MKKQSLAHLAALGASPRRALVLAMVLALAACGGGSGSSPDEPEPTGDTQEDRTEAAQDDPVAITIQFDWIANYLYAPALLAEERGYFEEEGLDVTFAEGGGAISPTQVLSSGKADIAIGSLDEVPLAVAEGVDLLSLAVIEPYSSATILARGDSGIESPQDLAGKTISTTAAAASGVLLRPYLEAVGVDPAAVDINNVDPGALIGLMVSGKTDAMTAFTHNQGVLLREGQGMDINVFTYADAGIKMLSMGIFTLADTVESSPDVVRGAVRAILRGYADGVEDPRAAAEAGKVHFPQHYEDMDMAEAQAEEYAGNIREGAERDSLGFQHQDDWEGTVKLLQTSFGLSETRKVSEYYTNDFLPEDKLLS